MTDIPDLRAEPNATADDTASRRRARYAPRRRVQRSNRAYSSLVGALRIFLPIVAAGLLLGVLFWPQFDAAIIPPEPPSVAAEMDDSMMVDPEFTALDANNRPFSVIGSSARPLGENMDVVELRDAEGEMTMENGDWVALIADLAVIDREAERVDLSGNVEIFRDDGYRFATDWMQVRIDENRVWGDAPVVASGPAAEVTAEGFRIEDGGDRVIFRGNSRLILRREPEAVSR